MGVDLTQRKQHFAQRIVITKARCPTSFRRLGSHEACRKIVLEYVFHIMNTCGVKNNIAYGLFVKSKSRRSDHIICRISWLSENISYNIKSRQCRDLERFFTAIRAMTNCHVAVCGTKNKKTARRRRREMRILNSRPKMFLRARGDIFRWERERTRTCFTYTI